MFVAAFMLLVIAVADHFASTRARTERIDAWLEAVEAHLESVVNARLQLAWSLEAFVKSNPQFTASEFDRFAGSLQRNWHDVRSVQLAPDGVIAYVSDVEQNGVALGINLFEHQHSDDAAARALEQRTYVLSGPHELMQGGHAIIGRAPVFLPRGNGDELFWGFAQIVIDSDAILIEAGLSEIQEEFQFSMRGIDGLGLEGDVFLGEESVFLNTGHQRQVSLPGGSWYVAATPRPALFPPWRGRRLLWWIGVGMSIVAGAAVFAFARWPQRLRNEVRGATDALQESRTHYRQLTRVAPTGIYESDHLGNVIFANERFREITGIDSEMITEESWNAALHPEDEPFANAEWDGAIKSGLSYCVYRYLHGDGRIVWALDRAMAVSVDDEGNTTGFIGTLTDITEQKLIEEELEAAKTEAEEANRAKDAFLASMSHEIRTPLNGILGMLSVLLQDAGIGGQVRERLTVAKVSADDLLDILNDLLDFSKIEAGKLEIELRPFDAVSVVEHVAALWRPEAEERGLEFTLRVMQPITASLLGDPKRLSQVLSNLVSNALKFTSSGGIEIAVRESADEVEGRLMVSVSDTGEGIADDEVGTMFERFSQSRATTDAHIKGTGLGLAICKDLVELMGGEISVSTVLGEGSKFEISLPVRSLSGDVVAEQPFLPDMVAGAPALGSLKILVAEDNLVNQKVIGAILNQPELSVEIVGNGRAAVVRAREVRFDVILMDIRMPEVDGIEAARQLRADPGASRTAPIIALTANASEADKAQYRAAGLDDCVTKPVRPEDLFAAMARAVAARMKSTAAGKADQPSARAS